MTQIATNEMLHEYFQTRSPELREELVLQSVPLVHYLLGRMGMTRNTYPDYEDLVHQGLIGLMEAVDRFDPNFETRFSTYASLRIRGKVLDYLRSADWMPRSARTRTRKIKESITALWAVHHREPTEAEIAAHLEMDVDEVRQGLDDANRVIVSMDMPIEQDAENVGTLHERLSDEKQVDPAESLEFSNLAQSMREAIVQLDERDQIILSLYYNDNLTFKEIGQVLEITESRVSQLHARIIISLKAMVSDE